MSGISTTNDKKNRKKKHKDVKEECTVEYE